MEHVSIWHHGEDTLRTDDKTLMLEKLHASFVVILLISAEFYSSAFWTTIKEEIDQIVKGKKRKVIPIYLKSCSWKRRMQEIADLIPYPRDQKAITDPRPNVTEDQIYTEIENGIWDLYEEIEDAPEMLQCISNGDTPMLSSSSPKLSISPESVEKLFHCLTELNYTDQINLFLNYDTEKIAAFLIRGEDPYGHEWLFRLLIRELPSLDFEPVLYYPLNPINATDIDSLWRGLGQRLGLSHTATSDDIAKKVNQLAQNQTVIIKLDNAWALNTLSDTINKLLKPICDYHQQIKPNHRILLFLIDITGKKALTTDELCNENSGFCITDFPAIKNITYQDLKGWYDTKYRYLRTFEPKPEKLLSREENQLKQNLNTILGEGIPQYVLEQICQSCYCSFREDILTRITYEEKGRY